MKSKAAHGELIDKPNATIDIRITSKAQNDVLAQLVDRFGSAKAAADELGVCSSTFGAWLNFRTQLNTHVIAKHPDKYRRLIVAVEKLTGKSFTDVFPELPKDVRKFLRTKRVARRTVTHEQLTSAVEAEKLSYEVDAVAMAESIDHKSAIKKVLCALPDREREMLTLQFGLKDGRPHTLEEIGAIFKLSGGRVRQITERAIRRLQQQKHSSILSKLGDPGHGRHNSPEIDEEFERRQAMTLAERVAEKTKQAQSSM